MNYYGNNDISTEKVSINWVWAWNENKVETQKWTTLDKKTFNQHKKKKKRREKSTSFIKMSVSKINQTIRIFQLKINLNIFHLLLFWVFRFCFFFGFLTKKKNTNRNNLFSLHTKVTKKRTMKLRLFRDCIVNHMKLYVCSCICRSRLR